MYKRYFRNMSIISLCFLFVFVYYRSDKESKQTKTTNTTTNYQTVIFKDADDMLIPIEVNLKSSDEQEVVARQVIEAMKSDQLTSMGLYPVFNDDLEVNALTINENILTIDFKNLKASNNQAALDIFESLGYLFINDEIKDVVLKSDGQDVNTIGDTTIPISCLTKDLGINNFKTQNDITNTTSIIVYNTKNINGREYVYPEAIRVNATKGDIVNLVALTINNIEYEKKITASKPCTLTDGVLNVYLNNNILLDSETIDSNLSQRIVKSLKTIEGVKEVKIIIDDQEVNGTQQTNSLINNRIKV